MSVAWSGDGTQFASGDYYGTVRRWAAKTGSLLDIPVDQGGLVVRFTHDGKWLVSAGNFGKVYLISQKGKIAVSRQYSGTHDTIAVSHDGTLLVVRDEWRTIHVLDLKTLEVKLKLTGHKWDIGSLALSPDGTLLASASAGAFEADSQIRLWSIKKGKQIGELLGHKSRVITSMLFDRHGTTLISSGADKAIRFWDVIARAEVRRIDMLASGMALSPDGKLLASFMYTSAAVHLWNPATGKLVRTLPNCGGGIRSVAFSPDSKTLLTGGVSRSLRLWSVETGREVQPRQGHHDKVFCLQFSPDGKRLASRGADQVVRVWDLASHKEIHRLSLGDSDRYMETNPFVYPSASLAYSADGKMLAAVGGLVGPGNPSLAVHLWDLANPRISRQVSHPRPGPVHLTLSADGKVLVSAGGKGIALWNARTGESLGNFPGTEVVDDGSLRPPRPLPITSLAFSPGDGDLAVASTYQVYFWDWQRGRQRRKVNVPNGVAHLAFSPGGQVFATAAGTHSRTPPHVVEVWESATGGLVASFPLKDVPYLSAMTVAISPNGRLLAAGCSDGAVRIWDIFSQQQLASWKGHQETILTVAFSPDGRTLASGGVDTTILLWDVSRLKATASPARGTVKDLALDLTANHSARAYRAIWSLVGHGDKTVTHLGSTLRPVAKLDADKVRRLIEQLGADSAKVRDEASGELEKLGRSVESALRRALDARPSAEQRRRLQRLLARLEPGKVDANELGQSRALLVLELLATPSARTLLGELAGGEAEAPLTRAARQSLARLGRGKP
jgi:WD40 repeat protein